MIAAIARVPPAVERGTALYSDLGYILLAARARRLLRSGRAMRLANRASAAVMGGAAAAIAAK